MPQAGLKHEVLITLHFITEKYPLDLQNKKNKNEHFPGILTPQ